MRLRAHRLEADLERAQLVAESAQALGGPGLRAGGESVLCQLRPLPPLLLRGGEVTTLEGGAGMALGVMPGPYAEACFPLQAGDRVLLYTDGATEATNGQREEFGEARLTEAFHANAAREPGVVLEDLLERLREFAEGKPAADDTTLLLLEYRGAA